LPAENKKQVIETVAAKNVERRHRVKCPRCGSKFLKRMARRGFLRRKIYPIFGYYPWLCTGCKGSVLIKNRGESRKNRELGPDAK
jgi:ssDNA-binding Zn-finger/Zn-ribbon topoisomerase 1